MCVKGQRGYRLCVKQSAMRLLYLGVMSDMGGKLGETRDSRVDVGSSRFESDIGQVRLNLRQRVEEGTRVGIRVLG